MPASRLDEIVANKHLEVASRKASQATGELAQLALASDRKFLQQFDRDNRAVNLICEIKPKSPSAGILRETISLDTILESYDKYARAISVLTDEKYFGGSLDLLRQVSSNSKLPTLCKDFIIDPHQCYEARLHGAEAVLLIVKILAHAPAELQELHSLIVQLGMVPVVEVQTEQELEMAVALEPMMILINNRNLSTFDIDLNTTEQLAPLVPPHIVLVSASGIETRSDIERLSPICNSFLIGSSLMKADNLNEKLSEFTSSSTAIEPEHSAALKPPGGGR